MKVSIIIPVKKINDFILESISKIQAIEWPDYEIIILTDKPEKKYSWKKTRIIATGSVKPAKKRDQSLKYAKGEILAFIDDDAFPETNWLKKSCRHFNDKQVAAVGGPAITPNNSLLLEKASGAVFESYIGGGMTRNRYLSLGSNRKVDDWPTVNLLVRKDVFKKINGFDTKYWPGEDTKLCLDIINLGYKIVYEPQAIVYHHRRSHIFSHLKQIGNYGLHRGFFAKKFPQTSLKISYFIPSIFVIYLILLCVPINLSSRLNFLKFGGLFVYLFLLFVDSVIAGFRWKNLMVGLLTFVLIFLTHLWYGTRFIQGLISGKIDE